MAKPKKKKVSGNSSATKSSSILTRKGNNAFNINNFKKKQGTKGRVRWNSSVKEKPFEFVPLGNLMVDIYDKGYSDRSTIATTTACDKIIECVQKAKGANTSEKDAAIAMKVYLKKKEGNLGTAKISVAGLKLSITEKWIIDAVISGINTCYPDQTTSAAGSGGATKANSSQIGGRKRKRKTRKRKRKKTKKRRRKHKKRTRKR